MNSPGTVHAPRRPCNLVLPARERSGCLDGEQAELVRVCGDLLGAAGWRTRCLERRTLDTRRCTLRRKYIAAPILSRPRNARKHLLRHGYHALREVIHICCEEVALYRLQQQEETQKRNNRIRSVSERTTKREALPTGHRPDEQRSMSTTTGSWTSVASDAWLSCNCGWGAHRWLRPPWRCGRLPSCRSRARTCSRSECETGSYSGRDVSWQS